MATRQENAREARRELSKARVNNWPNTLNAVRERKENRAAEARQKEELERQEVDRQEAALQTRSRKEAIQRANTILYEQTDKMKFLRSQQLLSDVVYDREEQLAEKTLMKEWEREREEYFHEDMLKQLKEAGSRETAEVSARETKARAIATIQRSQLDEYRNIYLEKLEREKDEGKLLVAKAQDDLKEDAGRAYAKIVRAKAQSAEMAKANDDLKVLRVELAKEESVADAKRKSERAVMENLAVKRKELEAKRFEERQQVRQRMIDTACQRLSEFQTDEDHRMHAQAAEARAREDNELEMRAQRREKQRAAIDQSRALQMRLRAEKSKEEKAQVVWLREHWKAKNAEIEAEELDEAQARKDKNMSIRAFQEAQVSANIEKRKGENAGSAATDMRTKKVSEEDDQRFRAIATAVYEQAKAEGKNTYMIEKALHAKDVSIMAVTGSRV